MDMYEHFTLNIQRVYMIVFVCKIVNMQHTHDLVPSTENVLVYELSLLSLKSYLRFREASAFTNSYFTSSRDTRANVKQ